MNGSDESVDEEDKDPFGESVVINRLIKSEEKNQAD